MLGRIYNVLVWVHLPYLPLELWSEKAPNIIGDGFGECVFCKIDKGEKVGITWQVKPGYM